MNTTMNEVYVILSTYNGERFLSEQLESILAQQSVSIKLYIRDDGSSDGTRAILASFAQSHAHIEVEYGDNIGVINSFFALLRKIPPDAEFVAFADQDDIWLPDKLIRAVDRLKDASEPVMYCSCYKAVDENGDFLWQSLPPEKEISFKNAIVQNITTGCTVVMNGSLLTALKIHQVNTKNLIMHDWWVYLVAVCFGQVIYDREPSMLYRQHGGNVVGAKNGFALWLGRIKRFFLYRKKNSRIAQAREFLERYKSDLSTEDSHLISAFLAYRQAGLLKRIRYAIEMPLYMQKKSDNLILKLQLILNSVH
ncbi:glycosyltransferase family 2 protein [Methylobacter sp. BlB1]|uniref:glycosyltransferase family 2 protein n=1 Tax=Methylobacter sp. BlB1 TaxID=2785914 RepID=UPI00189608B4|nr:glycosyltransferase family 2 protein [Methylobacter sp. BlB1]